MDSRIERLVASRGLVLRVPERIGDGDRRALERAWRRGDLVRLAPGTFCPADRWAGLPPWDRTTVAAVAFQASRRTPAPYSGLTAAHLHGLRVAWVPARLEVRPHRPGHRGARPVVGRPVAPGAAVPEEAAPDIPLPPGVRHRTRGGWAVEEGDVEVPAVLTDGTAVGRVRVDALPTVLRCVSAYERLPHALPVLDSAAALRPEEFAAWRAEGCRAPTSAARARQTRAVALTEAASESAGESASRGILLDAGVARPEVQREFRRADGSLLARTDFWWEEAKVAGEFDGITKYDVSAHASEEERRAAIRREKEREVELMRHVAGLARWTWSHLTSAAALISLVEAHGVPLPGVRSG